jgi:hypothetical protein
VQDWMQFPSLKSSQNSRRTDAELMQIIRFRCPFVWPVMKWIINAN